MDINWAREVHTSAFANVLREKRFQFTLIIIESLIALNQCFYCNRLCPEPKDVATVAGNEQNLIVTQVADDNLVSGVRSAGIQVAGTAFAEPTVIDDPRRLGDHSLFWKCRSEDVYRMSVSNKK